MIDRTRKRYKPIPQARTRWYRMLRGQYWIKHHTWFNWRCVDEMTFRQFQLEMKYRRDKLDHYYHGGIYGGIPCAWNRFLSCVHIYTSNAMYQMKYNRTNSAKVMRYIESLYFKGEHDD